MLKLAVILGLALASHAFSVPSLDRSNTDLCSYMLYTKDNINTPIPIIADKDFMETIGLIKQNTVILIHGHGANAFSFFNRDVTESILTNEDDVNVISVDWTIFASNSYSNALRGVATVASSIQNFINELNDHGITNNMIHIVGFDFGAHIAGFTGRHFASGDKIARITGLDPAGNSWGVHSGRLSLNDADYVEVIHTDGSGLLSLGLGEAIGHIDFFANGGSNQPGCVTHACSHNRAYELFAASFENENLEGSRCDSALQLTLNKCRGRAVRLGTNEFSKAGHGIYRINTRRNYPF